MIQTFKITAILLLFCGFLYAQENFLNFKTLDKVEFEKILEDCKGTFNITEDFDVTEPDELLKANDTSEEPHNVQCFLHCVVTKAYPGSTYENGSMIHEKLGLGPADKEDEKMMECLRLEGDDTCETTFKQFTCYFALIMLRIINEFFTRLAKDLGIEVTE